MHAKYREFKWIKIVYFVWPAYVFYFVNSYIQKHFTFCHSHWVGQLSSGLKTRGKADRGMQQWVSAADRWWRGGRSCLETTGRSLLLASPGYPGGVYPPNAFWGGNVTGSKTLKNVLRCLWSELSYQLLQILAFCFIQLFTCFCRMYWNSNDFLKHVWPNKP